MTPRSRTRSATVAVVALLFLAAGPGLAACSAGSGSESDSTASGDAPAADRLTRDAPVAAGAPERVSNAAHTTAGVRHRAEISHGQVVLRATDVGQARADVRRVVAGYDGEVTTDQTDSNDDGTVVTARLVLRVPARDFDEAMGDLRGVAELAFASADTKDVTTKVIDTRARLRAQRRSVHRVEQLLDRAQNLRDIVLIESELSQRQAALDSLEQQSAYLANQTSLATINVEIDRLHHAAPRDHADHTGFLAGLAAGWRGLTAVAVGLATALGAALPFIVVLLVLGAAAVPVLRAVRRSRPPEEPAAEA